MLGGGNVPRKEPPRFFRDDVLRVAVPHHRARGDEPLEHFEELAAHGKRRGTVDDVSRLHEDGCETFAQKDEVLLRQRRHVRVKGLPALRRGGQRLHSSEVVVVQLGVGG